MPDADTIRDLLTGAYPFADLPIKDVETLLRGNTSEVSYKTGSEIVSPGVIPSMIHLVLEGSVRSLSPGDEAPASLELLNVGSLVGWFPCATGIACDWMRAASPVKALRLPAESFIRLLRENPEWAASIRGRTSLSEIHPLIRTLLRERGLPTSSSRQIALDLFPRAMVLDSSSEPLPSVVRLPSANGRLIGIPGEFLNALMVGQDATELPIAASDSGHGNPEGSPRPAPSQLASAFSFQHSSTPPFHSATSRDDVVFACLRMIAAQLGLPFRAEMVRSALRFSLEGRERLYFPAIGSVADMIGIATQPLLIPQASLSDQDAPFLMQLGESTVVAQEVSRHGLLIADPLAKDTEGCQRWIAWKELPAPQEGSEDRYLILLCRRSRSPKGEAFGFRSFIPYIRKHTRTFLEVIVASFFIQIFALANPLIIQVIIDKVIVQESLSTLDVLAGLLIFCTLFGAALTAIRTFLFTDATNRIDLSIGLRILEHLYRLPLSYFHQRPVGEIASRLRELDKIRGFLTGTALTALIDAVFSMVYIAIMLFYSVKLTVIALLGVPLLVLLTIFVTPIIRRQLKERAEKTAATESHLVESITGIQTIKGQNIETRSRWKWFHRYGDTIAASFRNTITHTSASTLGMLINRFNDVAVLWVGVYMVIDEKLSLGQLIAFRILAGYVTAPLLRLAESWQNFQEASLSVNRLGDVANRAREDQDSDEQIPIPEIKGRVAVHDLDFSYSPGRLQLEHVSLDVPAGSLIAFVGLSGSGKSTLLKLIGRLYEPVKGSVEIDGFNLSKVELNSVRRQIGMVFQETLLMDGSVMENIAAADPEAPSSEVIDAAKLAEAHDFIMTLPNGYASTVGEQGRNLSGGQRQRIALARLIMQSPSLLLLDEATSALDAPTEQRVINNLRQRFHGKTIFFATHRLSTVKLADQIFYLEGGLIKESGTHEELLEKKGLYYALSLQQETAS